MCWRVLVAKVEVKNAVVAALKVAVWCANDIRKMMLVRWWRADVVVAVARIAVRLQAVATHLIPSGEKPTSVQ